MDITETIARAIAESQGNDPDDFAPVSVMCEADNSPVQWWRVFEEHADAAIRVLANASEDFWAHPFAVECEARIQAEANVVELRAALIESDRLLWVAHFAHNKMGLGGRGSDVRLPHETRMFALEFSDEAREGPGALQVNGLGSFWAAVSANKAALTNTPTPEECSSL